MKLDPPHFEDAFKHTLKHEGFYSNDPDDRGGETMLGVARNFNPDANILWHAVDSIKHQYHNLPAEEAVAKKPITYWESLVKEYYREMYWNPLNANNLPDHELAALLFDFGVNGGTRRARKFLQEGLNQLSRNGKDYPILVVDGVIGGKTIKAVNSLYERRGLKGKYALLLTICYQMMTVYWQSKQAKYKAGWFWRIIGNMKQIADNYYQQEIEK